MVDSSARIFDRAVQYEQNRGSKQFGAPMATGNRESGVRGEEFHCTLESPGVRHGNGHELLDLLRLPRRRNIGGRCPPIVADNNSGLDFESVDKRENVLAPIPVRDSRHLQETKLEDTLAGMGPQRDSPQRRVEPGTHARTVPSQDTREKAEQADPCHSRCNRILYRWHR